MHPQSQSQGPRSPHLGLSSAERALRIVEIQLDILNYLDPKSIRKVARVSSFFYHAATERNWETINDINQIYNAVFFSTPPDEDNPSPGKPVSHHHCAVSRPSLNQMPPLPF